MRWAILVLACLAAGCTGTPPPPPSDVALSGRDFFLPQIHVQVNGTLDERNLTAVLAPLGYMRTTDASPSYTNATHVTLDFSPGPATMTVWYDPGSSFGSQEEGCRAIQPDASALFAKMESALGWRFGHLECNAVHLAT